MSRLDEIVKGLHFRLVGSRECEPELDALERKAIRAACEQYAAERVAEEREVWLEYTGLLAEYTNKLIGLHVAHGYQGDEEAYRRTGDDDGELDAGGQPRPDGLLDRLRGVAYRERLGITEEDQKAAAIRANKDHP